ncbi:hypothetical protein ACFCYB_10240 [Streptomyces sp. NPDC056309]|uniref:hypothetical protein n=1 Tax=unclassified Streptomyces TaxID=2593676 RepID=UPI0035D8FE49
MNGVMEDEARKKRARYPIALAVAIGCYVLAAIAGMFFLTNHVGTVLQVLLWIVHCVVLTLLIEKLGAKESSLYAALFIVVTSLLSVTVAGIARDDLTLEQRGETVTVTVVKKWLDPPGVSKSRDYNYELKHQDGTKVLGPALRTAKDRFDVGAVLTVIEDPVGELRPQTPDQAGATGNVLAAGGFALAAVGAGGWMTWRGSDAARRRDRWKKATPDHEALARQAEQEEKLREALRTYPVDRRGYIKVSPTDYPDLSQQRAARIAWEMGLRAEAWGNKGAWRFKESVVEEVPLD